MWCTEVLSGGVVDDLDKMRMGGIALSCWQTFNNTREGAQRRMCIVCWQKLDCTARPDIKADISQQGRYKGRTRSFHQKDKDCVFVATQSRSASSNGAAVFLKTALSTDGRCTDRGRSKHTTHFVLLHTVLLQTQASNKHPCPSNSILFKQHHGRYSSSRRNCHPRADC